MQTELDKEILRDSEIEIPANTEKVLFDYGNHQIDFVSKDGVKVSMDCSQSHRVWSAYQQRLAKVRGLVQ